MAGRGLRSRVMIIESFWEKEIPARDKIGVLALFSVLSS
jgi:hypothetical protein